MQSLPPNAAYDNHTSNRRRIHHMNVCIHSHSISTSYPYIHHTCIHYMHCGLPRRRRARRDTPPAPPCRSEDYIDRRISSALFAPTFLALSPCPFKNAGLIIPAIEKRLGGAWCLPGSEFGGCVVKIPSIALEDTVGVGSMHSCSLMHYRRPSSCTTGQHTSSHNQALAALVCR